MVNSQPHILRTSPCKIGEVCDLLLDVLALALRVSLVQVVLLRQSRDALLRKCLAIGLHHLFGTNNVSKIHTHFFGNFVIFTETFGCFENIKMSTNIMKS